MSKSLDEIGKVEKAAKAELEAVKKKFEAAKKKTEKTLREWPRMFRCKKCGIAFKVSELGYKDWEVRRTEQECQPMGEYDMWQEVERQHLACCPKCGHDFNVEVWHSDYIGSTPRYSRWEDKPELKECYKKSLGGKIMKVDSDMVKYIKDEHGFGR